jgi:hypothetical protein
MTNDLNEMIVVVQAYILDKTGRRVRIEFNNVRRFSEQFEMLRAAYHHVMNERK